MTASRAAAALAALALVIVVTGGGGRAPFSACAWQAAALLAFTLAWLAAPVDAAQRVAGRWLAGAGVALAGWIGLSAALGVHRASAAQQASAWIAALALGGAWALVLAPRGSAADGQPHASASGGAIARAALVVSGVALFVVGLGHLGYPIGGRAGATLAVSDLIRPLGTFADPNHLTAFLVLVLAIHCRWAGWRGWAAGHAAACGIAGIGALLTHGRLAALAVVAVIAAEIVRRGALPHLLRSRRAMAAFALVMLVSGTALTATLLARRGEQDAWTRPAIWVAASRASLERPLIGLGPAGFQHAWEPFNFPVERGLSRFEKSVTTPHGEWLRIPIELGWPGAAMALLLCGFLIRRLGRAAEALPLAAGLLPFLAMHDAFHSAATAAWASAAVGLLLAQVPSAVEPVLSAASRPPARRAPGLVLAGGLLLALAIGWRVRAARAEAFVRSDAGPPAVAAALALDPGNPQVLLEVAPLIDGDPPGLSVRDLRADAVLEETERLSPRESRPVLERARLLRRGAMALFPDEGSRESVSETYARAAALAPRDAFVRMEAATVLFTLGDPRAAERFAAEALVLEPVMIRAHVVRVLALAELGSVETQAARSALERSLAAARSRATPSRYEVNLFACEEELLARALASR